MKKTRSKYIWKKEKFSLSRERYITYCANTGSFDFMVELVKVSSTKTKICRAIWRNEQDQAIWECEESVAGSLEFNEKKFNEYALNLIEMAFAAIKKQHEKEMNILQETLTAQYNLTYKNGVAI